MEGYSDQSSPPNGVLGSACDLINEPTPHSRIRSESIRVEAAIHAEGLRLQGLRYASQTSHGARRTKTVKRASKVLIEKYYPRLTLDFQTNKKIASEVAIIPSKRLRNKIAGFTTHLMKRIQRGPVRGISFKLQEEERERKDNYIPEVSALDTSAIEIDTETQNLLKSLNFEDLPGVTAIEVKQAPVETRKPRAPRPERA
ncbi:ribosomal S17-domain-containing protein [Mortierella sp. GBAus27b]|nr:ribosomal S17-domain-containing protein [Mortierella sp. GBAus27b]